MQWNIVDGRLVGFIPSRVTDISACAFYNCESLNKVDFSYGLRTISSSAFSGCNCLSSLILPDSVEVIKSGKDSFLRMDTLDAITISNRVSELPTFFDTREVKYPLFNGYIDHGWKSKSPPPVSYYDERETYQDTLSETIHIPYGMFQHMKSLESVTVPGSVGMIDVCCFADCESLETVILHEGTKLIRDYAFANCPKLREVVLPNSLETIERYAFKGCSALNLLYIGPNVSLIEEGVFEGCTSLTVFVQAGSYAEKYAVEHEIAMEIKRI